MDLAEDLGIGAGGATWTRPAGGMIASAGELVTLALGLGDPLVSPLSAGAIEALLLRPELATHERPGEFSALGLRARRLGDGSWLYMHSGNTGDFAAELVLVPARGFALALLGNTGDPLQATALVGVQELLGERVPLPLPAGPTSDYAGVYVAGDDAIAVELVGGSLTIAGRGLQGRLTHAGDHRFRAEGLRETLTFVFMGPGPASHLRGPEFVAGRVQAPRRK